MVRMKKHSGCRCHCDSFCERRTTALSGREVADFAEAGTYTGASPSALCTVEDYMFVEDQVE